jgi:phage terminase large subunit
VDNNKQGYDSDSDSIDISTEEQLLIEIESFYLEAESKKEKVENLKYILEKLQLIVGDDTEGKRNIYFKEHVVAMPLNDSNKSCLILLDSLSASLELFS